MPDLDRKETISSLQNDAPTVCLLHQGDKLKEIAGPTDIETIEAMIARHASG